MSPRTIGSWLPFLGLVTFSLVLYANNLHNQLVYDDHEVITRNEAAHGLENTAVIFSTPSWWSSSVTYVRHYRPFTTWTYALNYSLRGLRPEGYHVVNNLLHGLVCGLVYLALLASGVCTGPALLAAVLFLTHPVHAEAVSWINARADMLAGGFILLCLVCHARSTRQNGKKRLALVAGGLFSYVLAGLSKETGFMAPFVILAWDLVILNRARVGESLSYVRAGAWKEYGLYLVLFALFVCIRVQFVGGAAAATVSRMASPLGEAGWKEQLFTGSYVTTRYARVLLWPARLSVDYSPDEITRVTSVRDPRTVLGLATVLAYLAATLVAARRSRVAGFFMAAAAIVFAPGANILFPVGTIMAERLMYLPVLALCVPLALAVSSVSRLSGRTWLAPALAAVIVIAYGTRTFIRNRDWRDEEALFLSALAVSPRSAMAHKNLASALHRLGRNEEAIPLAQMALQILPEFPDARYVLGNCYFMTGRIDNAVGEYRATLSLVPTHASAHLNLGAAYHVAGRPVEALERFDTAITLDPRLDLAWFNRIHTLVALGRLDEAERALDDAVHRFPRHPAEAEARAKVVRARAPTNRQ